MFDPISLVAGAALLSAGYLSGRITRPSRTPQAICGCGHGLDQHEPASGRCHGEVKRAAYNKYGSWVGHTYPTCTCQQYVGPVPIEQLIQTQILPPQ